jgi:hypothetical protein
MRSFMARLRLLAPLLTIAAVLCAAARGTANRCESGAHPRIAALEPERPKVVLASGLAATIADAGLPLVSIIAADIDADGDLDVVASDSSLQLHIWVNDGAGHFTRRRPSGSTTWRGEPTGPTVDNRPATSQVSAQNDPPSPR